MYVVYDKELFYQLDMLSAIAILQQLSYWGLMSTLAVRRLPERESRIYSSQPCNMLSG